MSIIDIFPEEILEHIFFFCGIYNTVNRKVCRDFARIAPWVDPLLHLNHLLSCGQKIKLPPFSNNMAQKIIHLQLLSIMDKYEECLPENLCEIAVCYDLVKVLFWTRWSKKRKEKYAWANNVTSTNPDVLKWIRLQRQRYRLAQEISWMEQW
ncbi:Hypothetical protein BRZCDTV_234 [Brazilian cedratvirus IHUMI]|uniref:F-box domain-containing protein n=1 Tax=Brazilian cedratvirus IHUMI TaxID=2126980 RepID=A0A2R8FE48_9VIRU|nr:Hypothetical protein BRZCDTV_234 [Brazilian cedratvirus IHUMI]